MRENKGKTMGLNDFFKRACNRNFLSEEDMYYLEKSLQEVLTGYSDFKMVVHNSGSKEAGFRAKLKNYKEIGEMSVEDLSNLIASNFDKALMNGNNCVTPKIMAAILKSRCKEASLYLTAKDIDITNIVTTEYSGIHNTGIKRSLPAGLNQIILKGALGKNISFNVPKTSKKDVRDTER